MRCKDRQRARQKESVRVGSYVGKQNLTIIISMWLCTKNTTFNWIGKIRIINWKWSSSHYLKLPFYHISFPTSNQTWRVCTTVIYKEQYDYPVVFLQVQNCISNKAVFFKSFICLMWYVCTFFRASGNSKKNILSHPQILTSSLQIY